jgi:hypothetical protein
VKEAAKAAAVPQPQLIRLRVQVPSHDRPISRRQPCIKAQPLAEKRPRADAQGAQRTTFPDEKTGSRSGPKLGVGEKRWSKTYHIGFSLWVCPFHKSWCGNKESGYGITLGTSGRC